MTNLTNEPSSIALTAVVVSSDHTIAAATQEATRRCGEVWNVFSVDSADRAEELVSKLERVDIVIVHGSGTAASLLERVRGLSPQSVRIAVSGRADDSVISQLAASAHQILAMPLDIDVLSDLIGRVRHSARTGLRDPVRTLVGQADRLPSPPAMFQRLNTMLATDDWRLEDLAAEIATDVALTSELLKLVNSSFYGLGSQVWSVTRAVSLIGTKLTRFMVLGNQLFASSGGFDTWIDLERLSSRSNAVARGARALAFRENDTEDAMASAFLAGLVSEIGLLVLARIPDIDPTIAAPVNNSVFLEAERVLFGGDRFEVGAQLLTLWGFDSDVIDAVGKLSTGEVSQPGELAWYVASARQLVINDGADPDALAKPGHWDVEIDRLIEECSAGASGAALAG